MDEKKALEEKLLKGKSGMAMMLFAFLVMIVGIVICILGPVAAAEDGMVTSSLLLGFSLTAGIILFTLSCILLGGLKIIRPNEALVLTLFGNYYGTFYKPGFYWVNPFCSAINPTAEKKAEINFKEAVSGSKKEAAETSQISSKKKVSLKAMTLNNQQQKVNDELGNPIEIGTVVIWKVKNATKAVLNVENYQEYLSIQCDAVTRNAARSYPYDTSDGGDEKSLRGSTQEIADLMQAELQNKVLDAGIEILDVRITRLAYAPEIASAMLQRQQAAAIIDARQKIVEGAVSMVQMALQQLSENDIVELDEERKAAMVSNLLVVLCGNKDAQPIVNSGSIY